jgi:hypothetical protein
MLRSRMLPDGFKLYFGIAVFALFSTFVIGVGSILRTTDGNSVKDNVDQVGVISTLSGPLSVGWKGSVGNHVGYTIMFVTMVAAAFIAFLLVAFRDADPEAQEQYLGTDSVPLTRAPAGSNFAPVVGAIAAAMMGIGWIVNTGFFWAGAVLLVLTIGTWATRTWAERATGDDEVNAQIYHRIIDPLRVPIVGAGLIAFVVLGISRVFNSAPSKDASTVIFLVAGAVIFATFVAIAVAPKVSRSLIVVLLAIGALLVIAGAIYGIKQGDRPLEGEEHKTEAPGESHEGGLAPIAPISPISTGTPA